jgi:hypothetical protein
VQVVDAVIVVVDSLFLGWTVGGCVALRFVASDLFLVPLLLSGVIVVTSAYSHCCSEGIGVISYCY